MLNINVALLQRRHDSYPCDNFIYNYITEIKFSHLMGYTRFLNSGLCYYNMSVDIRICSSYAGISSSKVFTLHSDTLLSF